MIYRKYGRVNVELSLISLGGHEYLPDGRSRGFAEDLALATHPGHLFAGFGQSQRLDTLRVAYDHGVNFFDVTQDSEKEALGRNLKQMPAPYPVYIQTRPEGLVYTYDPHNRKMADYAALKAEVQRGLGLLQRERLDFLNLGIMHDALEHDPEFLTRLKLNVEALRAEGLIRFACADTLSGEYTYLRMIESGAFDALNANLNFADHGATRKVLAAARVAGMAVFVREAFMKGELFAMGRQAGIDARDALARTALKWCLAVPEVTTVTVGAASPEQLRTDLGAVEQPELGEDEVASIERVRATDAFKAYEAGRLEAFFQDA